MLLKKPLLYPLISTTEILNELARLLGIGTMAIYYLTTEGKPGISDPGAITKCVARLGVLYQTVRSLEVE